MTLTLWLPEPLCEPEKVALLAPEMEGAAWKLGAAVSAFCSVGYRGETKWKVVAEGCLGVLLV